MQTLALAAQNIPLLLCGLFYALLCVFSLVTGVIYLTGRRELNPLELSDSFVQRLSSENKLQSFARFMGFVTFVVGIVQGITAYALIRRGSTTLYWIPASFMEVCKPVRVPSQNAAARDTACMPEMAREAILSGKIWV
jgi:hypothetical protein